MLNNIQKYQILIQEIVDARSNNIDVTDMYGKIEAFEEGFYTWSSEYTFDDVTSNNSFQIFYRQMGTNTKFPPILLLHDIGMNLNQCTELQRYLSRFFRTISIDILGMGKSSKPKMYKSIAVRRDESEKPIESTRENPWLWKYDTMYIYRIMKDMFPNDDKFAMISYGWSCGISLTYSCSKTYKNTSEFLVLINPPTFDGSLKKLDRFRLYLDSHGHVDIMDENIGHEIDLNEVLMLHDKMYMREFSYPYIKNGIVDFDAMTVLVKRVMANNSIMPVIEENKNGLHVNNISSNMLVFSHNKSLAYKYRIIFDNIICIINFSIKHIERDYDRLKAESIINTLQGIYGPDILMMPFFGFTNELFGDELSQRKLIMAYKSNK